MKTFTITIDETNSSAPVHAIEKHDTDAGQYSVEFDAGKDFNRMRLGSFVSELFTSLIGYIPTPEESNRVIDRTADNTAPIDGTSETAEEPPVRIGTFTADGRLIWPYNADEWQEMLDKGNGVPHYITDDEDPNDGPRSLDDDFDEEDEEDYDEGAGYLDDEYEAPDTPSVLISREGWRMMVANDNGFDGTRPRTITICYPSANNIPALITGTVNPDDLDGDELSFNFHTGGGAVRRIMIDDLQALPDVVSNYTSMNDPAVIRVYLDEADNAKYEDLRA